MGDRGMIGDGMGNPQRSRDRGLQAHGGNRANDLSGVQRRSEEQDRQVFERDVQGGWRGLALLALWVPGREVF